MARRSPPLPPPLLAAVARRRRGIIEKSEGDVLEIGEWWRDVDAYDETPSVSSVRSVDSLDELDDSARFDTIVTVLGFPRYADLPSTAAWLGRHLTDTGRLRFVEPVGMPGLRGAIGGVSSPFIPALAGLHLDRDVPSALRASGLVITDNERFRMPTLLWSLRNWVDGVAQPADVERGRGGVDR